MFMMIYVIIIFVIISPPLFKSEEGHYINPCRAAPPTVLGRTTFCWYHFIYSFLWWFLTFISENEANCNVPLIAIRIPSKSKCNWASKSTVDSKTFFSILLVGIRQFCAKKRVSVSYIYQATACSCRLNFLLSTFSRSIICRAEPCCRTKQSAQSNPIPKASST